MRNEVSAKHIHDGIKELLPTILYAGIASVLGLALFLILHRFASEPFSHRTFMSGHLIFIAAFFGVLTYGFQKLRKSQTFSNIVLRTLPFPMDIVDSQGTILFANKHMLDIFGRDIRGERCWEIYMDDCQQSEMCPLRESMVLGQTKSIEVSGALGGQVFDVWHTWIQYEGKPAILEVFQNITERKRREVALIGSEKRHRTLFASSQDALMTLAPPSWAFIQGNAQAIRLFGAKDEVDFVSRAPWEFSPECQPNGVQSSSMAKEMIEVAMRYGTHSFEWLHRTLSGREFFAAVTLTRLQVDEQHFLQATVRDLTAIKNVEREKAATQAQLLHASKLASLGSLAAGVGHEINNPLAIILTNCDVISRLVKNLGGNEEIASCLEDQRKAVKRGAAIVKGLRSFARVDTSENKMIDIHKTIKGPLSFFGPLYLKDGIAIEERLNSRQPFFVGNEGKLQQVIINLLSNAKDACEGKDGGIITVETADEVAAEGARVVLRISDSGSGISQEHLTKIFEPFFTTKPVGKGTGIGLPISYSIIQSFGGTMSVESEQGKGTSFRIAVPLSTATSGDTGGLDKTDNASREQERVREEAKDARKFSGHALIVDDEETLREVYKKMLTYLGVAVTTAPDGVTALEILKTKTFDCVFVDNKMPGMSGLALILPGLGLWSCRVILILTLSRSSLV